MMEDDSELAEIESQLDDILVEETSDAFQRKMLSSPDLKEDDLFIEDEEDTQENMESLDEYDDIEDLENQARNLRQ